jgi:hypothetical protein
LHQQPFDTEQAEGYADEQDYGQIGSQKKGDSQHRGETSVGQYLPFNMCPLFDHFKMGLLPDAQSVGPFFRAPCAL